LTVTAAGINKVYDTTGTAAVNLSDNRIAGDVLTSGYSTANFADKNVGAGKTVNVAGISLAGVDALNYSFNATAATTADITAKALSVSGITASNKVYDGNTTATVNTTGASYAGLMAGDVLSVNASGSFADKNVANGKTVTLVSGYSGADAGNYSITSQATTTADITAKALTITAAGVNKVYDASTAAAVALNDNRIAGDVLTTGYTTASFADKNVGTGKAVNVSGISLAGADALNYSFNTTAATTADITGKALTVSGITASNKVYDGNTSATVNTAGATYTGLVTGDVLAVNATGTFADKNAASGKVVTLVSGYTGVDAGNYFITNQATTTADITAKTLTVAAAGINKTYDATTTAAVNLSDNRILGDVLTSGYTTANFADKNVGTGKTVNVAGVTLGGADAANYTFNTTAVTAADITTKALTVSGITASNKVYDGTTVAAINTAGASYTGLIAGDSVTANVLGATGSFADKNAGTGKSVNIAGIVLTGADALNYSSNATAAATADITAKALTITAAGVNKVYDASTAAVVALTDNRIAGDVLTTGYTAANFADKNVGAGKTVNVAGIYLTGADALNYSSNVTAATTADITAKALTISGITASNKVYDGTTVATLNAAGANYTGLIAGDSVTANVLGATGSFVDKNAGTGKGVNITGIVLTGTDALNYSSNATAATTADITAKALTVAGITAANKVYDGTTAATVSTTGATYTGLVAGDVLAVNATGTFADKNAAPGKVVTLVNGYSGADAANYFIINQASTTADITAKALTITASEVNKVYDASTAAVVNLGDNRILGDVLTTGYTTASFADKNVGTGKAVNVAGISLTGADSTNYTFNTTAVTAADITVKALTVAGITAANKVYDGMTAATINTAGASYTGLIAGDSVMANVLGATGSFVDKNAGIGKSVNIAGIVLTGADALNYSSNATAAATADITAKVLTVSGITASNKVYDGNTTATVNTTGVNYAGLVAGDVLSVNATGVFADKNAANGKTVMLTSGYTGADAGNYTITSQAATTADITAKAITITAAGINKVYDASTAAVVNLGDNRILGDVLTTGYTTASFADKNVGTGKVVNVAGISLTGADSTNYTFNTTAVTAADITAQGLSVSGITASNKVYDGNTVATVNSAGAVYTGIFAGDVVNVSTTGAFADKNVAAGKAVMLSSTSTGADAGNYTITNQAATTADITAKALTVAAAGISKVYDANTTAAVNLSDNRIAGDVLTSGYTTASFADKNVGTGKTVNVAGVTLGGIDAANYTFNTTAVTVADITVKALTVAGITAGNKVYDGNTSATVNTTGASYAGLMAGDVLSVNTTGTFADKNAANGKTVTLISGYSGADAGNYSITSQASTTADITAKALTVAGITAGNKVYDSNTSATINTTGASYTGLVAGDVLSVNATGTFADKNAANGKTVTLISGYSGADAGNYSITSQATTTADITAKALTVTASGINKVYDASTAATVALTDNRIAGDVLTSTYTAANFADKNVGAGKAVNVSGISLTGADALNYSPNVTAVTAADITAKALTVAGITAGNKVYDGNTSATVNTTGASYAGLMAGDALSVNASGTFANKNAAFGKTVTLTSGYSGADAGNYNITSQASTTADITAKALSVSGITASNKVYDGNTTATVSTTGATYAGRVAGDAVSVNATGVFADKNAATGKTVALTSGYSGADVANYAITSQTVTFAAITPAVLSILANAQGKIYGAPDPALTYTTTGLISSDTVNTVLTGALARMSGEDAGAYAINQGSLASGSNYTMNYTGATLTITAAPVATGALLPIDIINTVLIPGNVVQGAAHSTIQTSNILHSHHVETENAVSGDNDNRIFASSGIVCRDKKVSGQNLQVVPICAGSVH
jgi:hypothetical protein